jgi:hypothetical protein
LMLQANPGHPLLNQASSSHRAAAAGRRMHRARLMNVKGQCACGCAACDIAGASPRARLAGRQPAPRAIAPDPFRRQRWGRQLGRIITGGGAYLCPRPCYFSAAGTMTRVWSGRAARLAVRCIELDAG